MSKKSKFQPRVEHYTLSGKVDPLVHRSFRELEDVFEYIQSQIRKELEDQYGPDGIPDERLFKLISVTDGTSFYDYLYHQALRELRAERQDWNQLSDEQAQQLLNERWSELVRDQLTKDRNSRQQFTEVDVTLWDSPIEDGEQRPLVKQLACEERIKAELARKRKRPTGPATARPAFVDDQLWSMKCPDETDCYATRILFYYSSRDARNANRSVFVVNDNDRYILVTCKQVRWVLSMGKQDDPRPFKLTDKKRLEGSAALPFEDLIDIRVLGLLLHEYVGKGIPGYGLHRLIEDDVIVTTLAQGYRDAQKQKSKAPYDKACQTVTLKLQKEWSQLSAEVVTHRTKIIESSFSRLYESLCMLQMLEIPGSKVPTFSKSDLRKTIMKEFSNARPPSQKVPAPVIQSDQDKRRPRHKLKGIVNASGDFQSLATLGNNRFFPLASLAEDGTLSFPAEPKVAKPPRTEKRQQPVRDKTCKKPGKRKGRFANSTPEKKAEREIARNVTRHYPAGKLLKDGLFKRESTTAAVTNDLDTALLNRQETEPKRKRHSKVATREEIRSTAKTGANTGGIDGEMQGKEQASTFKKENDKLSRPGIIFPWDCHSRPLSDVVRGPSAQQDGPPVVESLLRFDRLRRHMQYPTLNHALNLYLEEIRNEPPMILKKFGTSESTKKTISNLLQALCTDPASNLPDTTPVASLKSYTHARDHWATDQPGRSVDDFKERLKSASPLLRKILNQAKSIDLPMATAVERTLQTFPPLIEFVTAEWEDDITQIVTALLTSSKERVLDFLSKLAVASINQMLDDLLSGEHDLVSMAIYMLSRTASRKHLVELFIDMLFEEPITLGSNDRFPISPAGHRYLESQIESLVKSCRTVPKQQKQPVIEKLQSSFRQMMGDVLRLRNRRIDVQSGPTKSSDPAEPQPGPSTNTGSAPIASASTDSTSSSAAIPAQQQFEDPSLHSATAINVPRSTAASAPSSSTSGRKRAAKGTTHARRQAKRSKSSAKDLESDSDEPKAPTHDASMPSTGTTGTIRATRVRKASVKAKEAQVFAKKSEDDESSGCSDDDYVPLASASGTSRSTRVRKASTKAMDAEQPAKRVRKNPVEPAKENAPVKTRKKSSTGKKTKDKGPTEKKRTSETRPSISLAAILWPVDFAAEGGLKATVDSLFFWVDIIKRDLGSPTGSSVIYVPTSVAYNPEHLCILLVDAENRLNSFATWFRSHRQTLERLDINKSLTPHSRVMLHEALRGMSTLECFDHVNGSLSANTSYVDLLKTHVRSTMDILLIDSDELFDKRSEIVPNRVKERLYGRLAWLIDCVFDTTKLPRSSIPSGDVFINGFSVTFRCNDTSRFRWPNSVPRPPELASIRTSHELIDLAVHHSVSARWPADNVKEDTIKKAASKDIELSYIPLDKMPPDAKCRVAKSRKRLKEIALSDMEQIETTNGLNRYWHGTLTDKSRMAVFEYLLSKARHEFDEATLEDEVKTALDHAIVVGFDLGETFPLAASAWTFAADGQPVSTELAMTFRQLQNVVNTSNRRLRKDPSRRDQEKAIRDREIKSILDKVAREFLEVTGIASANGLRFKSKDPRVMNGVRYENLLSTERRKALVFVGIDAPNKGKQRGRHSAVWRNTIVRHIERYCRQRSLEVKFVKVGERLTSKRCACCGGELKLVEYLDGEVCLRVRDCPKTGRRLHRDLSAAENMTRKGIFHILTGSKDWP